MRTGTHVGDEPAAPAPGVPDREPTGPPLGVTRPLWYFDFWTGRLATGTPEGVCADSGCSGTGFSVPAMARRIGATSAAPATHLATVARVGPRVLVIDNYDSFVYNLVQYLGELGAEPIVYRHDALTLDDVAALEPSAVLVSPGPGRPEYAGLSTAVIRWAAGRVPVLGVCLGHQCIGAAWGGTVIRAPEVVHGKTSQIHHDGDGVFAGLPTPLEATRYHSLLVERSSLPDELVITATSDDGLIMGLRHRDLDVEGVQFHPESILTASGHDLLANFLNRAS